MIVNQIHLVSTPLDIDYKNVYDGVSNKREMRSFLLNNFDNIFIANGTTNTSIRFEKDLTITLNIPFNNNGINITYESLRKYNYMIITAKRSKTAETIYYDTFFYFITNFTVENSISNNNMPSGITNKYGGYFTTTFSLKWDVWNNNIEDINSSKYYEQFFIRKHIDDFRITRDSYGIRYDGRNTYENIGDKIDTNYEFTDKKMYNRKDVTVVFLRVFLDGQKGSDEYASVEYKFMVRDDENNLDKYYLKPAGLLIDDESPYNESPYFYKKWILDSNVVSGLRELYIPFKVLDTYTREDVTDKSFIYLKKTKEVQFGKEYSTMRIKINQNLILKKLNDLGDIFKFAFATVQFFNYQVNVTDDTYVITFNKDYMNYITLTKDYEHFWQLLEQPYDEGNYVICFSPDKTSKNRYNSIYKGVQKRDTDAGYFIRTVPAKDTKSIGSKMNCEPNLHYFPYECQGIFSGNKFYPLLPIYNKSNVIVYENGIGELAHSIKLSNDYKDFESYDLKPFIIEEKTSFLPYATNEYISQFINKYDYIEYKNLENNMHTISNALINTSPTITKATNLASGLLNDTINFAGQYQYANTLGTSSANISGSVTDENFCFDDIVFVKRVINNLQQKESIYRLLEMYGIFFNKVSTFENTRTNFDYQQTDNCTMPLIKDLTDRKEIENLFNRGVRKWHIDTGYMPAIISFDNEYINLQITLD